MELISLEEAALLEGVSVRTIRRRIDNGDLKSFKTGRGLKVVRKAPDTRYEALPSITPLETGQVSQERSVPLEAHLAALELAGKQIDRLSDQCQEERLRANQAERFKMALEGQLAQYQRALSESAESLAQERALRATAEARANEPKGIWSKFRRMLNGNKSAKEA